MPSPSHRPRRLIARLVVPLLAVLLATGAHGAAEAGTPRAAVGPGLARSAVLSTDNPVTPGSFTGYGFDQCLAPTQYAMDRWLEYSPFFAVGIYISGKSRGCRQQPNLTRRWVATQLRKGWRLLPITLGPQASCHPGFPRYSDDVKISPAPGPTGRYGKARRMGRAEAETAVQAAQALGIVERSTLWYDLEGFDVTNRDCRESALSFLSGWTARLHSLSYVSGVYSSAGSGIKALDDARVTRPDRFHLPDRIWIARWDGVANTSTSYIREDGWRPGRRVKQYQGGHDETWGGVRINIDRNYLDLGRGSVAAPETHCGGTTISFKRYVVLRPPTPTAVPPVSQVKALQCLLTERGYYTGRLHGRYNSRTLAAVHAWQQHKGFRVRDTWGARGWISLLVAGNHPVLKVGSAGGYVRRVQRALNAADRDTQLRVSGVMNPATVNALRAYQAELGLTVCGVVNSPTWAALASGRR